MKNLFIFVLVFAALVGDAQDIMVVHVDGDAYVIKNQKDVSTYDKLVLGSIPTDATILVKENTTVRLIADETSYVDLSKESSYKVSELTFKEMESKGMFSKFCKYFSDFFAGHSSAEAKSSYRNRIYAVSRGKASVPSLDFPVEGSMPFVSQPLTFSWTHSCEDCRYVFEVVDYKTRTTVFAETTEEHAITLDNMQDYLKPATKYYWSVAISGEDLDYQNVVFDVDNVGDYETAIKTIHSEVEAVDLPLSARSILVYTMQRLEEQGLTNYSIYYGQTETSKYDQDDEMRHLMEQAWYSYLESSY